jgi:hypothetical protein
MIIGIDFDNTLAIYDDVIRRLAREEGLVHEGAPNSKRGLRDLIRRGPDGETQWRRIQGRIYGALMDEARLADGAREFLLESRRRGMPLFIVSHKSAYSSYDPDRIPLQNAARAWMHKQGFFDPADLGFASGDVYFETTREAKVSRLSALGANCFIDDLVETFENTCYPAEVRKILFTSGEADSGAGTEVEFAGDWDGIRRHLFGE